MPDYMSDAERDTKLRTAMKLIEKAKVLNNEVTRLRSVYESGGEEFGEYGEELDALLATSADLTDRAETVLSGIDDNTQPILQVGGEALPTANWNTAGGYLSIPELTNTSLPASGTIRVTGSTNSNDGDYTVTSLGVAKLNISESFTDGDDNAIKITWLTYP